MQATLLKGRNVHLEPLNNSHREELRQPADNELIWQHIHIVARGVGFNTWFDYTLQRKENGEQIPFVVRRISDGFILGSTGYLNYAPNHHRIEIGATWYVPEVWSTPVNPECKLLLLTHAFEVLNVNRVALCTDLRNERSQAAIAKLGAIREGVLRSHMITQGERIRDTVVFSIIASEWEQVKANLVARLKDQQS